MNMNILSVCEKNVSAFSCYSEDEHEKTFDLFIVVPFPLYCVCFATFSILLIWKKMPWHYLKSSQNLSIMLQERIDNAKNIFENATTKKVKYHFALFIFWNNGKACSLNFV